MHLLLYTDEPGRGGVAQYNHRILLSLIEQGYRVTCVQSRVVTPLIEEQQRRGIRHRWLNFDTYQDFHRTFTNLEDAQRILEVDRPDLVIFSDGCPFSNFAAKQAVLRLGIPFLCVIGLVTPSVEYHFPDEATAEPFLHVLARVYQQAAAVIAVSQENLDLLHRVYRLPPDQGQVIYYGRPNSFFAAKQPQVRDRLRQEWSIPADAVVCFTAARLEAIKGYLYQLEAIAQLKDLPIWNQLYFVWAGDGSLHEQLREAIAELQVGDRVKLIGRRWDIDQWHDAADIFILPSELEGMPLAIMEAMAKGTPVIATTVSGIPEEIGETGELLPNPNLNPQATVEQLVATLQTWVSHPSLRESLAIAAQRRAHTLFTEERMIHQTLTTIQTHLPTSPPPHLPTPPVSPTSPLPPSLPTGDYVSSGLAVIQPDAAFPHMVVGDPRQCPWPYLRREIPHNWYVDDRNPMIGFLSRDEAHILYNTALQFKGKRALEIGCWMGWSTCHLALAGVQLDVIDPMLAEATVYESVKHALTTCGVAASVNLIPEASPKAVEALAHQQQRQWSLIFIDGDHEAPGPLRDAIACEHLAAPDAIILFHDLASPDVAQGLDYLRQRGWQTLVYQTMQIMGVAWRGNVQPIQHYPDPEIDWKLPSHLTYYPTAPSPLLFLPPLPSASPGVSSPFTVQNIVDQHQSFKREETVATSNSNAQESQSATQSALPQLPEAIALFNQGQAVAALQLLDQILASGATVPELQYFRSICLCEVGRHREGLAAAQAELAINPNHVRARRQVENLTAALTNFNINPIPTAERPWRTALPQETLQSIQAASHNYAYRGVPMIKNPFDLALYPLLLWQLKPRTIIEIGSKNGGSALWFGDMLSNFGIAGHVYSLDIVKVTDQHHPRVTFLKGNGRALQEIFTPDFINHLSRPFLVIDDADHTYETTNHILNFFHPLLQTDEYIVIEDGIISDLFQDADYNSGPHQALKEFLAQHADEYAIDENYCDFFGYNLTWNTNGYLRKLKDTPFTSPPAATSTSQSETTIDRLFRYIEQTTLPVALKVSAIDRNQLKTLHQQAVTAVTANEWETAIATLQHLIQLNPGSAIAHHRLSRCYWHQGDVAKSVEHYIWAYSAHAVLGDFDTSEFQELLQAVRPYTLLSEARLLSLYRLAKQICLDDIPGHFVECGTYKGGAAALLAAVIKRYSLRPRSVYAFDTFTGMPEPTESDRHAGIPANETDFGAGTLSAPIAENLEVICQALKVKGMVVPIPGLFAETLPEHQFSMGEIALLHADGDWYESTLDILNHLYDSVVLNGIIQIDDYGFWEGCQQAVHDFSQRRCLLLPLRRIDDTGVWLRKEAAIDSEPIFWQTFWQLAQTARKLNDHSLAERATQAVLKILPGFIPIPPTFPTSSPLTPSTPPPPHPSTSPPSTSPPAPPEPDAETHPHAFENLMAAGIFSIRQLKELIQQYQREPESWVAIGQLRRVRQQIAEHWVSTPGDELQDLYDGPLGQAHTLILQSNLRTEPLTQAEAQFKTDTLNYLAEGLSVPGAIQHLLAALLYTNPLDWAAASHPAELPDWLLKDYVQFWLITPPLGQAPEQIVQYYEHLQHLKQDLASLPQAVSLIETRQQKLLQDHFPVLVRLVFKLREVNLIAFPDWQQPEEVVFQDVLAAVQGVMQRSDRAQTTFLIYVSPRHAAEADLLLSGVLMQLLSEDAEAVAIDTTTASPEISLISHLSPSQWQHLLPYLAQRVMLTHEDQAVVQQLKMEDLSTLAYPDSGITED